MAKAIEVKNLTKIFPVKEGEPVIAGNHISFTVEEGDIFGIIGLSGAGKSTLVRCLNLLEKPTEGEVLIDGQDLTKMSKSELREKRKKIGMIFQSFNLIMQRNVLDNVCFPLEIAGMKKKDARKKALEYLEIVGLSDKANSYPAQLSGGQKQRVAIARVLASEPGILLCDEATSALDPETTKAILSLLKKINREYGITMVLITHEMAVVQEICHHVLVLDKGEIVEEGQVEELFRSPKTDATKRLLVSTGTTLPEMKGGRRIRVSFDDHALSEPVIANAVLQFKTPINIVFADIQNVNGSSKGQMIIELPKDEKLADEIRQYFIEKELGVEEWNHVE